ncbi:hypothetical protein GCM10028895_26770 [Pontibacter rugosus]
MGNTKIDSLQAVQEEPLRTSYSEEADTAIFAQAFNQFFSAMQSGDTVALNNFIDPKQGFWVIEQPGAMPAYTHYKVIQKVRRKYQNKPFTSITEEVKQCQLVQREELPNFDCGAMDQGRSGFTEEGCFYTTQTKDFRHTDMWKYANLSNQRAEQVQDMQEQVDITVLHTATSYRFHFGYRNGSWRLFFADLRVPCSA